MRSIAVTVLAPRPLFTDLIYLKVPTRKLPFVAQEFFAVLALLTQIFRQPPSILQPVLVVLLAQSIFAVPPALSFDYQPVLIFQFTITPNFTHINAYRPLGDRR